MVGAITRGLTLDDFDRLTIGQIVDFCIEYNDMQKDEEKETTRAATQADFNAF